MNDRPPPHTALDGTIEDLRACLASMEGPEGARRGHAPQSASARGSAALRDVRSIVGFVFWLLLISTVAHAGSATLLHWSPETRTRHVRLDRGGDNVQLYRRVQMAASDEGAGSFIQPLAAPQFDMVYFEEKLPPHTDFGDVLGLGVLTAFVGYLRGRLREAAHLEPRAPAPASVLAFMSSGALRRVKNAEIEARRRPRSTE